jgi:hypothetical protein
LLHLAFFTSFLGEAHLPAGNRDEALSVGRQALALTRDRKERGHEAWALRLVGEIHSRRNSPETELAEGRYRESLGPRREARHAPPGGPLPPRVRKACCRTSDYGKARKHLTTTAATYREMGMDFWLEKAEAALEGIG